MSQNAWRTLRTLIRYFVYAGSGLVVLFAIMICLSFLMNPFAGFAGQSEFSDLAGHSAKRRLSDCLQTWILETCKTFPTNLNTHVTAIQLGTA